MGDARTRIYCDGQRDAVDVPLAEVSDHLARPGTIVWVDLCDPTKEQLHELAGELGLHELAVEDALGPHQRPKLDHYETHLFLSCHSVELDLERRDGASVLRTAEIDAFINPRWLVTVRKDGDFSIASVVARWDRSPSLTRHGVSFLLYGLLDVVIDGYFNVTQAFDDFYDEASESIFEERAIPPDEQRSWFTMRRALVTFHRLVVPMREAISGLMRREHEVVPDELYPYYQDLYDHILRVSESTDSIRDLVATIVETNLSLRDYRQNLVMKKVTSWAAIAAAPTLITGYYGMNVPFPGDGRPWGFAAAAALMAATSGGLYVLFKRRGWL